MEKLESIVQRMIDAGEPEENIKAVIQEYSGKAKPHSTGCGCGGRHSVQYGFQLGSWFFGFTNRSK